MEMVMVAEMVMVMIVPRDIFLTMAVMGMETIKVGDGIPGSHVFSSSGYPSHLTRYSSL